MYPKQFGPKQFHQRQQKSSNIISSLILIFVINLSASLFLCTQCCDLEQLVQSGSNQLIQSIEHSVQNSNVQIVFHGITTNIYGSAVHVVRNSNGGVTTTTKNGGISNSASIDNKLNQQHKTGQQYNQNNNDDVLSNQRRQSEPPSRRGSNDRKHQIIKKLMKKSDENNHHQRYFPGDDDDGETSYKSPLQQRYHKSYEEIYDSDIDTTENIDDMYDNNEHHVKSRLMQRYVNTEGDLIGAGYHRISQDNDGIHIEYDDDGMKRERTENEEDVENDADDQQTPPSPALLASVDDNSSPMPNPDSDDGDMIVEDDIRGVFTAYFELINTYKGANILSIWDSNSFSTSTSQQQMAQVHRHRVNVTFFEPTTQCLPSSGVPREYIVFCELQGSDLRAISVVHWSEENELRVWNALGWGTWSDWSSCSVSCGNGIQQRSRFCTRDEHRTNKSWINQYNNNGGNKICPGPNIEQRSCNSFSCQSAVNPLALEDRRFFHPSRSQWARVPERPNAWHLQPNAYIWVPVSQVFPMSSAIKSSSYGSFPKEFTVFVTLRIQNDTTMGTLWSLRSRRQQDAYLSLELAGTLGVNLVHANGANGTDVVRIPANLGDGMWHRLALGIKDDSTVNSYVDCEWLRTDILKKDALNTPEDADLIIGYLFSGDLEQLVIVPNANVVSQQCSANRTPITDRSLESRMHTHFAIKNVTSSKNRTILTTLRPPKTELEIIMENIEQENSYFTTEKSSNPNQIHWNIVPKKSVPQDYYNNNLSTEVPPRTRSRNRSKSIKRRLQNHHHKRYKKKLHNVLRDNIFKSNNSDIQF